MEYPRPLRPKELDLLETVLPVDRPGYRALRCRLESMTDLGEGRRGEGDLVLGLPGDLPDSVSPLSSVIAYGMKSFSDEDLLRAFVAYNALRQRVPLHVDSPPVRRSGIPLFIRQLFKRRG